MKWAIAVVVLGVALFGACQLLPERFAVNAPLSQLLFGRGGETPDEEQVSGRMQAADGFSVGIFAEGLPNARFLRFTDNRDLLVSLPRSGQIVLVEADGDGDGRSDGTTVLLEGLNRPHGIDLHNGWLYVGEANAIVRFRFDAAARAVSGEREVVVPDLPEGGNHWTRNVRFGPDGNLYVSVGSSCNVCIEEDERRAAMLRYDADGQNGEVFAGGLRNSVGFDWQPGTNHLYATDNGRDLLGDDFPPCELNLVERGRFYGWPFANGDNVIDPDLGAERADDIAGFASPAHPFRAHNAPLGITFVRNAEAPASLRGAALVALHGSWNRTKKDGYKVVSLHWGTDGSIEERDFLTGFEVDDDVIGRPVDVAEGPDGAFYVSDDYAGVIWRVGRGAATGSALPSAARPGGADGQVLGAAERSRQTAAGRALYEEHACASCHEAEAAEAGVVVKPLAGLGERYTVDSLVSFFAAPTPPMPLFPLEGDDAKHLAVYLLETYR